MLKCVNPITARPQPLNLVSSILIRSYGQESIRHRHPVEALLRSENDSYARLGFIVGTGDYAAKLGSRSKYQVEASVRGWTEPFLQYVVTAGGCGFEIHLRRSTVGSDIVSFVGGRMEREGAIVVHVGVCTTHKILRIFG